MWKPRLASFALLAFSFFTFWLGYDWPFTTTPQTLFVFSLVTGFAALGMFSGLSGVIASFMATRSGDDRFVLVDNVFTRFLVKIQPIELSENTGFCVYSFSVGLTVVQPILGIAILYWGVDLAQGEGAMEIFIDLGTIVALSMCFFFCIYLLSRFIDKFPKLGIPMAIASMLFLGVMMFRAAIAMTTAQILSTLSFGAVLAVIIGVIVLVFYVRHLFTRTRWYAKFCPQYMKIQNANDA